MKQWIYDKIFKIYDKDKINLPSEYERNNDKPNNRTINHIRNLTLKSQKVFVNFYHAFFLSPVPECLKLRPKLRCFKAEKNCTRMSNT